MAGLHEIEKKLRKEYFEHSKNPDDKASQQKLNELFYNTLLAIIKEKKFIPKGKTNFSNPVAGKIPRKRNAYSGSD